MSQTYVYPPPLLEREVLPDLERHLSSVGSPDNPPPVPDLLDVERFKSEDDGSYYDFSLSRQLPGLIAFQPHTILFTAHSAIPMADVFRGVYDEIGRQRPTLGFIKAPSTLDSATVLFEQERLADVVAGQRVAVVDEYVCEGGTLRAAMRFCEVLRASAVHAVAGRWYHQADTSIIDHQATSSELASDLHPIGRRLVKS